jgi:hemerythrin superfamily protein
VTVAPGDDVVSLITQDHAVIEQRFSEFDSAAPDTHAELFVRLRDQLVRHEYAEQGVVYPELEGIEGGSDVVDARVAEEAAAEKALAELQKLDASSAEFLSGLAGLRASVLAHAHNEEAQVLPLLTQHRDQGRLVYLGQKFKSAKLGSPTHPHPHAPRSPRARKFLSPITSFLDRMRDPVP